MSKTTKDENFPVGRLVNPKLRPIVQAYYAAARKADDIADNYTFSCQQKLQLLNEEEKNFFAANDTVAGNLGQIFVAENLDCHLYTDLLEAFRRDAKGTPIEIWEQLLDYCRYSAAPVGRFMLAIHDESTATYLPAETLCAVLQITNHLQDMKADACNLRRCYLPTQMMNTYGVEFTDICLTKASPALQALIKDIITRLKAMLKDAKILFSLVQNRRLKAELGVIFSLTNSMLEKIEKGDVIALRPNLNLFDWQKAFLAGVYQGLFTRVKLCKTNNKIK